MQIVFCFFFALFMTPVHLHMMLYSLSMQVHCNCGWNNTKSVLVKQALSIQDLKLDLIEKYDTSCSYQG